MIEVIRPDWPAPASVCALTTTRLGGASEAPFEGLNLGDHVGDDPAAVAANRKTLLDASPGLEVISWLEQVHGTEVVMADAQRRQGADGQFTQREGIACAIMTADCLPVLFCDRAGTQVAAAHAGWRGLCAGVLEKTLATFPDPAQVLVWLGPAIGPANFEVGAEVRELFLAATPALAPQIAACFSVSSRSTADKNSQHYLADIYLLARFRLQAAGVTEVYGGGLCTFADATRFYSYRRDHRCGRMASLIYLIASDSCS